MPLYDAAPTVVDNLTRPVAGPPPSSFGDTFKAAIQTENVVAAAHDMFMDYMAKPEEVDGFNALEAVPQRYQEYAGYFAGVGSPQEARRVMARIDRDRQNQQVMANAGFWTQIGAVSAGLALDPTIWASALTPLGIVRNGLRARRVSQLNTTVGRLVGEAAVAEGAISAAREAALHANQPLRTMTESMVNIAGDALLTGLFSAPFVMRGVGEDFATYRLAQQNHMLGRDTVRDQPYASAGAAARDPAELQTDEAIQKWLDFSAKIYDAPLPRWMGLTPLVRMTTNTFGTSTRVANELFNHGLVTADDLGYGTGRVAAEIEIKQAIHQPLAEVFDEQARQYGKYVERIRKEGGRPLSPENFDRMVWRALSNGDVDLLHPEVSAAARVYRRVFNDQTQQAVAVGRIDPEDLVVVGGSKSWKHRQLNADMVRQRQVEFEKLLRTEFRREYELAGTEITPELLKRIEKEVQTTVASILQKPTGRANTMDVKSPIAQRTLRLSDEVLEPWLIPGALENLNNMLHHYAPDNVMLARFGEDYLPRWLDELRQEYEKQDALLIDSVKKNQLRKEYDWAVKDLERSVARARGRVFEQPGMVNANDSLNRAANYARTAAYMAYMGAMAAAALPDIAFTVLFNGFSPTLNATKQGVAAIASKWLGNNPDAVKKYKQPMRAMAVGVEDATNQQMTALGDLYTPTRVMHAISQKYTTLTGIVHITNAYKYATGYVVQDALVSAARKGISGADGFRLRKMGLNAADVRRIGEQFNKHGEVDRGVQKLNLDRWDLDNPDVAETARKVRLGTLAEVDRTIVTPGIGDKPLFVDEPLRGLLFQFQSFFMASWNQITLPALQRTVMGEERKFVEALGLASALGASSFALREINNGRGEALADMNASEWTWHALDRGGLLSFVMNFVGIADSLTKGAIKESVGVDPGVQYRPSVGSSVPALSYLENAWRGLQVMTSGGPETDAQLNNMYRILPGYNLLAVKPLAERIQQQQIEEMGLRRTRRTELNKNWREAQKEIKRLEKQREKELLAEEAEEAAE